MFMKQLHTVITTYAGISQSMGAVFSVTYGKDRVIMDFGSGFDPEKPEYIKRDNNWIKDKLDLDLLPGIDGLYPEKYIKGYDLAPFEQSDLNTAVFISHLHLDHMSNIGALARQIPVYMSYNARRLEYALEESGQGVDTIGRTYSTFENMKPVKVGQIRVLPIMNSPYSYNMYGFMVETPDLKVGYTADLSLSYEYPAMVRREMELFRDRKIDLLYCDNCNFTDEVLMRFFESTDPKDIIPSPEVPEGMQSFDRHYETIAPYYLNAEGLVVFNHYEREMLDVEKICAWAEQKGRQVVFEPEAAYLVFRYFGRPVNVHHLDRVKNASWHGVLKDSCTECSFEEINRNPDKYFVQISFSHIDDLAQLNSDRGVYIHAEGYPFNSKDIELMKRKVAECGFAFRTYDDDRYFQHGYPSMVKYFVDQIQPKVVIGYHGRYPERIIPQQGINLVPELYQPYRFVNGMMVKEEEE